ncbi:Gp49 family protein [Vreelandella jeotgali]|uniref:Gp49 family protein n=1 Tax=Vreelandella jeotgali TaxID=553386 RepID=UPI0003477A2B|nr:Gp49 family protein [Halomonas jeotgali]
MLPNKVTPEAMEARIAATQYTHPEGTTLTFCILHLDNGYTVTGESACVDPANFDAELGRKIAHEQAFDKLWPLFGFLLAEDRYREAGDSKATGLDFGEALKILRAGGAVKRAGWNGQGMYVFWLQGSNTIAKIHGFGFGEYMGEPVFRDALFMYTANGELVPWSVAQSDALAEDWEIVQ